MSFGPAGRYTQARKANTVFPRPASAAVLALLLTTLLPTACGSDPEPELRFGATPVKSEFLGSALANAEKLVGGEDTRCWVYTEEMSETRVTFYNNGVCVVSPGSDPQEVYVELGFRPDSSDGSTTLGKPEVVRRLDLVGSTRDPYRPDGEQFPVDN